METIIKIGIGFVVGILFTLWTSENPKQITVEKYSVADCPSQKLETARKEKVKIEVAFETCHQFLQSYMAKVDKLQDEIKWKDQQLINCNDEIKYYRGGSTYAPTYSD